MHARKRDDHRTRFGGLSRACSRPLFDRFCRPLAEPLTGIPAAPAGNLIYDHGHGPKQTPATYRMLRFFGAVIVVARIVGIVSAVLGLVLQDGYASASVQIIIFGLILIVAGVGLYCWCQRRVGNS